MLEERDFPIPNKPKLFGLSEKPSRPPDPKLHPIALHHIIREKGKPFAEKLKEFDLKFVMIRFRIRFEYILSIYTTQTFVSQFIESIS